VYGYDYPEDASPFSFVTRKELERIAGALRVTTGMRFADIACGQAGPSLCVARATGAFVIGIDSSEVAIGAAKTAAGARGLAHRAAFLIADAAATGLRSASTDGVMSIDALQLMKHRDAVLAEISRILKPGGRFAFTPWVSRQADKGPAFPVDYGPLLHSVGLSVESCDEPSNWEPRETAVFAAIRDSAARLRMELGETVASMLASEADSMPQVYPLIRRLNIVARKRG